MIELDSLFNNDDYLPQFDVKSNENFSEDFKDMIALNNEIKYELSKSTEGVIGNFLLNIIKILGKVIAFIFKCVAWITKTVINKVAHFVAWITRKKEPPVENSKGLIAKLKSIGHSKEDQNPDSMQGINALAADIKSYIKSPDDVKNMKPEELVFYKVFLISVSLEDTKYLIDLFNRQTSLLKENGDKIDKRGQTLVTFTNLNNRNNKPNSEEWWLDFSLEDNNQNDNHTSFTKMSDVISKDNRFSNKSNVDKDYENIINSIYRSIHEKPDDTIWLNKLKTIFSNGARELTTISKSIRTKQKYLEEMSKKELPDKLKKNIQEYSREVSGFQGSITSYINCINYFAKYQNIRMNLVRRFNSLSQNYRNAA